MTLRFFIRLLAILSLTSSVFARAIEPALPNSPAVSLAYERLQALDFAALKVALEQAGWPATHVQAFLNVEISHRINPPTKLTAEDLRPFKFWHTGPDAEPLAHLNTLARRAEQAQRDEAISSQFDALFPSTEQDADRLLLAWETRRKWGSLSEEKRQAVTQLLSQAEKARDAFTHRRGGMLTRDEHHHLWKLAEDTRADLVQLLTREELLDYDLRNSATANRMRGELDNFQPTQAEFLTIFQLRHPLELNLGHKSVAQDPTVEQQRAEAEKAVEKALARLLGPKRYDEYRISLQPACQLLQFDGRFARTDAATVRKLYRALRATQWHLREAESSSSNKTGRVTELKKQLYDQFRQVFDEEGTRRYLQEQELWP
jgi:hypothetical protein